jgi:hypothetical protein
MATSLTPTGRDAQVCGKSSTHLLCTQECTTQPRPTHFIRPSQVATPENGVASLAADVVCGIDAPQVMAALSAKKQAAAEPAAVPAPSEDASGCDPGGKTGSSSKAPQSAHAASATTVLSDATPVKPAKTSFANACTVSVVRVCELWSIYACISV